jgi:predicted NACHT family NTPase
MSSTLNILSRIQGWARANSAAVGFLGALIGGFLTSVVWPSLKSGTTKMTNALRAMLGGRKTEAIYLDAMISLHRYLPTLPQTLVPIAANAPSQGLDNVYVSLSVGTESSSGSALNLGDTLSKYRCLVLLGDPGAGKTTILKFIALSLARARRGGSFSNTSEAAYEEEKRTKEAQYRVKHEFGFIGKPLPVSVELSKLKDLPMALNARSMLDIISSQMRLVHPGLEGDLPLVEEKLRAGDCVFLFDSFDEFGSQEARARVATMVGEFCAYAPEGNRFIVASRIVGYQGQLSSFGFQTVTVQRLTWELTTRLVHKWYEALGQSDLALRLLSVLEANPRLNDLATNPMLLSLMVLVQYVERLIPDRRHVLYGECVKILMERRYASHKSRAEFNDVLPADEATILLRAIACAMHRARQREVPRQRIEDEILRDAVKDMGLSKAASLTPQDIVGNIEQRSQLLVERGFSENGDKLMAFSHLTFQEYLVSKALHSEMISRSRQSVIDDLLRHYDDDQEWWEEVTLLFAAQLEGKEQQHFFNLLEQSRKER